MHYIYILHFNEKLSHAQHYVGCTTSLRGRLTAHANGAGSRLTREIMNRGIEWQLGGLMHTTQRNMRRMERALKNIAHASRYCEVCSKEPKRLTNCTPISVAVVPFAATSRALRDTPSLPAGLTIRFAALDEPAATMDQIKKLMKADKDALGFIPAAGEQGIGNLSGRNRLALIDAAGEILGYTAFTMNPRQDVLTIHQACVRDDMRLQGLGRKMVQLVRMEWTGKLYVAKVRHDLAANHFWPEIGFVHTESHAHETSGNLIHTYHIDERS